jgi:diguanylate cyclase (GGDEF)-like protein
LTEETTKVISFEALEEKKKSFACLIVIAGSNAGQLYRLKIDELSVGRSHENTIPILEDGVSRNHCKLFNLPGGEVFIQDLHSTNGTIVNGEKISQRLLKDGDKIQIGSTSILKFTYNDKIEENFQKQMYESALRDGLTQIYNKRYFVDRFDAEFSYALRHKFPLTLMMIDLDLFKNVNDTYGHLCGDAVLIEFTRRITETIRSEDVFARYGGEEFVLIARGIAHDNGMLLAERIRRIIGQYPFTYEDIQLTVTASFGVASIPFHKVEKPVELIELSDKALYVAKRSGRNQVCTL